jgi:hypothetical protein
MMPMTPVLTTSPPLLQLLAMVVQSAFVDQVLHAFLLDQQRHHLDRLQSVSGYPTPKIGLCSTPAAALSPAFITVAFLLGYKVLEHKSIREFPLRPQRLSLCRVSSAARSSLTDPTILVRDRPFSPAATSREAPAEEAR